MLESIKNSKYALLVIIIAALTWLITLPILPNHIPMQYTLSGEETWGTNKYLAGILLLAIMIFVYVVTILQPNIDPKQESYAFFDKFYVSIVFFTQLLIFVLGILLFLSAMDYPINLPVVIGSIVGTLMMFIGNFLPKVPTNWFVGIRNPWTISKRDVWVKVHRETGRFYLIVGFILLVLSITGIVSWAVTIAVIIIFAIYPHVRSFMLFNKEGKRNIK